MSHTQHFTDLRRHQCDLFRWIVLFFRTGRNHTFEWSIAPSSVMRFCIFRRSRTSSSSVLFGPSPAIIKFTLCIFSMRANTPAIKSTPFRYTKRDTITTVTKVSRRNKIISSQKYPQNVENGISPMLCLTLIQICWSLYRIRCEESGVDGIRYNRNLLFWYFCT